MKSACSKVAVVIGLSLFLGSANGFSGSAVEEFEHLGTASQQDFQGGHQVVQFGTQTPWPSVTIFQRINATAEESAAMFFDYAYQVKYIPNLTKAVPVMESKTVYNVDYQVKLPFIPSWMGGLENYSVRDELTTSENGHAYEIQWTLIPGHGETVKSSVGNARFEDMSGATLLVYTSFIVPNRTGAGMGFVIDGAKDSVKKAVLSIVKQVEKEKSEDKVLLQTQLEKLRAAFSN